MEDLKKKGVHLLRWSEKYTKTDMVYLCKNSGWVLVGRLATSVSAFAVMVVLANYVSEETLGEYRYVIAIVAILTIASLPGTASSVSQSSARGYRTPLRVISNLKTKWATCAVFASIVIGIVLHLLGKSDLGNLVFISSPFMWFFSSYFIFFPYLQGFKMFKAASILQLCGRIIFAIIMISTALFFPNSLTLIISFLVGTILTDYLAYSYTRKKYEIPGDSDPEIILYTKYMTLVSIPSLFAGQFDKIIIGTLLGPVQLAVYTIATILPLESARLGRIVAQIALPKFSQSKPINFYGLLRKIVLFEFLLICVWGAYAVLAPFIFAVFFSQYQDVVSLSIIAMLLVTTAPVFIIRKALIAKKKKKELNILLIVVPVAQSCAIFIGLYFWGMEGVVYALLIGAWSELLLGMLLLHQTIKRDSIT